MSATVEQQPLKKRLGGCPGCGTSVVADAYAVRYRGVWHHLRCAIERDQREQSAFEPITAPEPTE